MRRNPVGWFEIYVQDTQCAKAFYETVFETRLEKWGDTNMKMWMFPNIKDGGGAPRFSPSPRRTVVINFHGWSPS